MNKIRATTMAVAVAGLALFGVPATASAAPCFFPRKCFSDTQVAAVTDSGGLFHAVRNGVDGSWTPMSSIPGQAGNIGHVVDTSASINHGTLYVAAVTDTGGLYLTRRQDNGSWTAFGDVK